jgi:hypothetical protein
MRSSLIAWMARAETPSDRPVAPADVPPMPPAPPAPPAGGNALGGQA